MFYAPVAASCSGKAFFIEDALKMLRLLLLLCVITASVEIAGSEGSQQDTALKPVSSPTLAQQFAQLITAEELAAWIDSESIRRCSDFTQQCDVLELAIKRFFECADSKHDQWEASLRLSDALTVALSSRYGIDFKGMKQADEQEYIRRIKELSLSDGEARELVAYDQLRGEAVEWVNLFKDLCFQLSENTFRARLTASRLKPLFLALTYMNENPGIVSGHLFKLLAYRGGEQWALCDRARAMVVRSVDLDDLDELKSFCREASQKSDVQIARKEIDRVVYLAKELEAENDVAVGKLIEYLNVQLPKDADKEATIRLSSAELMIIKDLVNIACFKDDMCCGRGRSIRALAHFYRQGNKNMVLRAIYSNTPLHVCCYRPSLFPLVQELFADLLRASDAGNKVAREVFQARDDLGCTPFMALLTTCSLQGKGHAQCALVSEILKRDLQELNVSYRAYNCSLEDYIRSGKGRGYHAGFCPHLTALVECKKLERHYCGQIQQIRQHVEVQAHKVKSLLSAAQSTVQYQKSWPKLSAGMQGGIAIPPQEGELAAELGHLNQKVRFLLTVLAKGRSHIQTTMDQVVRVEPETGMGTSQFISSLQQSLNGYLSLVNRDEQIATAQKSLVFTAGSEVVGAAVH